LAAYFGFKAYTSLDVGLKDIFGKSKIIFVFFLSIIFLKEIITWQKIIGMGVIFIALIIMSYKPGKRFGSLKDKAVQYTLFSSLIMSCALLLDKYAQNFFTPGTYSFLVYFIPTLMLLPFIFISNKKKELKQIYGSQLRWITLSVVLGVSYYYWMLRAFRLEDASIVYPIIEASILVTIISAFFYLKEKKDILKRILCAILILAGVIVLAI
ncbi:MAG TPA: EamA family transporter, partial [Alphaproteobacteria bacterium]|nr:EamA family transporter [Alphaproteobacteria bacterium]